MSLLSARDTRDPQQRSELGGAVIPDNPPPPVFPSLKQAVAARALNHSPHAAL